MKDEIFIAWAAGLFEGKGTITPRKSGGKHLWQLAVTSTDEDVITRLHAVLGGKKYGPYGYSNDSNRRREHHKPYWRWSVSDRLGIEAAASKIGPYLLGRRKARLEECLAAVAETPFTRAPHQFKRTLAAAEAVKQPSVDN